MLPPSPKEIPTLYARALELRKKGRSGESLSILRRILLTRPDTPEVLYHIGRIEGEAGRRAEAEAALREALALKPREPQIWQALHGVLSGGAAKKLLREASRAGIPMGSETEARPILSLIKRDAASAETKALAFVKSAPGAFWPALALGRARLAQSKWAAALGPLEVAQSRDPSNMDAALALGQCLARLDRPLQAEALLAPIVDRSDTARLTLAGVYRDTLRLEEATGLLRGARKSNSPTAAIELALTEAALAEVEPALAAAKRAVAAGAAPEPLFRRLSQALERSGATDGAMAAVDAGLAVAGATPGLATHRASLLQSEGRIAEAEGVLVDLLRRHPDHAEAYRAYMAGRKVDAGDPLLAQLMDRIARPDHDRDGRRMMNFAAAKAMIDLGRPADAFALLDRANRLTAEAFPYGFEADVKEARALAADWEMLKEMSPTGPEDPVLFVTGLPRSGTTLVETILAAHSAVEAGGEMPFLGRALLPAMEELRAGRPDASTFADAGRRYLSAGRRRTGGTLFTDKAIATFSRVGHALTALPGARVVILRRDPRDVGYSMYRNMFPDGLHRYTNDLTTIGRYIRLHDALIAFWAQALPDRVHIVDYEALTADPEPHIRALVEFAGLPWEDACLSPEKSRRRVETLSFAQVRAPIGQGAVAGWRKVEAELQPLLKALEYEVDLNV